MEEEGVVGLGDRINKGLEVKLRLPWGAIRKAENSFR